tara:strand:+ start:78 stop:416 length:339 start_codon:yes stop_codon:yes gene_type:complete
MITYDWNCRTVDARSLEEGETNVVYNVHWKVTGTSDQTNPEGNAYSAGSIGTQTVTWNPEGTFIPFEDLTNEMVVEWAQAAMGGEQVASIETSIAGQIESLIRPTTVTLTIE